MSVTKTTAKDGTRTYQIVTTVTASKTQTHVGMKLTINKALVKHECELIDVLSEAMAETLLGLGWTPPAEQGESDA